MTTVVEVDLPRKRIGLSMKSDPFAEAAAPAPKGNKPKTRKTKEKEPSMEEKLAMLLNKFKK
jgi:uncharacterized protein